MKTKIYFSALILFLFAFTSCNDDDDTPPQMESQLNIVETASKTDVLSSLVASLAKSDESPNSDLIGALSGTGPFTVFAPTNDAFTALFASLDGYSSLDDFDTEEEKALLATILKYHVVAGAAVASGDLTDGQVITTLSGEDVTVTLNNGVFFSDASEADAQVVTADVDATNGIVHVINKVLLPQTVIDAINLGTLVDVVVASDALTVLEAAVIKAGLVDTLNSDGPFTVFAPTDTAFLALLDMLGDDYTSLDDFDTEDEIQLLKDILLYHVVPAKVLSTDLAAGEVGTALADNTIEVVDNDGTFVISDASDINANISAVDIMASNGVAHVIDKVLLPQAAVDFIADQQPTIVDLAVATNDLSLLVGALQQADAGLVELLGTDGPFTVFAPTNAAFAALLEELGDDYNELSDFDTEDEKEMLATILKYHVVAGTAALSTDLSNGQMIATAQGEDITINLTDGVFIQDATDTDAAVATADIEAKNGVIHIIDKVLLPQAIVDALQPNIVELAIATDDLSLLVGALQQADAGLVELLGMEGPFTVFAPSNAAFEALFEDLGPDYTTLADFDTDEEKALLADILKYHVVSGAAVLSTDLTDGQLITTALGQDLTVNLTGGVFIADAGDNNGEVITADVEASNGVVHIINKVLFPDTH
ncbi:putative surface protein with fasciclin (FAS1) repeats [Cellulophaga sp. RHA19]|uniref:fasciclin domain-containing protein n=1 Tax=Cellulophaga sp. RHA19 TaxID=1798237 RepID=UPI000C2BE268|nr:fasciclin domain-containing protein [Cellulophaga sp. RHA19]PKB43514.1 putative surface protein with fasciclin (FAS1) repeats [Cellulophaga sp. RHA19]